MILHAVFHGLVIPAVAAFVVIFLGARIGRRGDAIGSLAIAAGLCTGWLALAASGQIRWDFLLPEYGWHWLLPGALLGLAPGIVENVVCLSALVRLLVRCSITVIVAILLCQAEIANPYQRFAWTVGVSVVIVALWNSLRIAARFWGPFAFLGILALISGAIGGLLERAGILSFAQLGGVLAAVLIGAAIGAWKVDYSKMGEAAVPACAILLPGLLFTGYHNAGADLPIAIYLMLLAAPFALAFRGLGQGAT